MKTAEEEFHELRQLMHNAANMMFHLFLDRDKAALVNIIRNHMRLMDEQRETILRLEDQIKYQNQVISWLRQKHDDWAFPDRDPDWPF